MATKAKKAAKVVPEALRPVAGMRDVLPFEQPYREKISRTLKDLAEFYGFRKIETPVVERADVFIKGLGIDKEDAEKSLFLLKTKDGEALALRPDAAIGVSRLCLAHSLSRSGTAQKLWHTGPIFRPQALRQSQMRQFTQTGFEIIGGGSDPIYDAQVMVLFAALFQELKIKTITLRVNSAGCRVCKPLYRKQLANFLKTKEKGLCKECQEAAKGNPLRVFSCKKKECREVTDSAPDFMDKICSLCSQHLKAVLEYLDETGAQYVLDNRLVRSADYYNRTVFEFVFEQGKESEIGTIAAGGRYDALTEVFQAKPVPSVGGAVGLERLIEAMRALDVAVSEKAIKRVFVAHAGELAKKKALKLIESLRVAGIPVMEELSRESLKAQLKAAEKNGAGIALILGQREVFEDSIIIRDLKGGLQETFPSHRMVDEVKKRLRADPS